MVITRREFIQIGGLGLASLFSSPKKGYLNLLPNQLGRVIYDNIYIYHIPSFNGDKLKVYWKDSIIDIKSVTVGDIEPTYNRIWYRVGDVGYAHSGGIQPVRTILQEPNFDLPEGGALAEVTVPYTDAYWKPTKKSEVAYRYYYETTHWVIGVLHNNESTPWYQILDDKWDLVFYVPANHIRILPHSELTPLSPNVPQNEKRIEVRIIQQAVIAYEWDRPVYMTKTATGAEFSNGRYYTPGGRHIINHKRPSRHMAAGNLAYNGFDLPGVPWVSYITERGAAFHGTYWHNDYGRPRSHGCINLTPKAAKWIYRWTLPKVPPDQQRAYEKMGTIVDVI